MTREEAIEKLNYMWFKEFRHFSGTLEENMDAIKMAIKALEQEPCEDCISRQAMLEIQAKYAEYVGATKFWQMRDEIKALPPVTPQRKTGHWIDTGSGQECSECGEIQYGYDNFRYFCANCGTKMINPQERKDKELDEAIEYYDEYTYTQLAEWLKELRQLREYKLSKGARDKE